MLLLILFAFIAGFVTILSPCILPVLPIVLSASITGGHKRPLGIVLGFIASFTFFTLALTSIVKATGIPADSLRIFSIIIILLFGVSLLIPQFQVLSEKLFSKLTSLAPRSDQTNSGFWGGLILGLSLGLVWTPCVGPIIASVITLAATSQVTLSAILITLAYSAGTAIPMFLITYGGRRLLQKIPWLLSNTPNIQKGFGILMILISVGMFFNLDRQFQNYILEKFPQYGAGLTKIEDNPQVKENLQNMGKSTQATAQAPELIPGGEWFNTQPLTLKQLKGKVVLIDFWTYTCINCIRTLPYVKSWYDKYHDQGLVIIGVHTPEFEFEKVASNVKQAIKDDGIKYPVMQDNNYDTWKAYSNQYWPAEYLIDAQGNIRHTHFGEGEYDQTEKAIQDLLKEAGQNPNQSITQMPDQTPQGPISPETYLGYQRMEFLYPGGTTGGPADKEFTLSKNIPLNSFSFGGNWKIGSENAQSGQNAVLEYNFQASNVYLVIEPPKNSSGQIKVFIDGKPNGTITVDSNKLYNIFKSNNVEKHLLRLEFLTPGIMPHAFQFG